MFGCRGSSKECRVVRVSQGVRQTAGRGEKKQTRRASRVASARDAVEIRSGILAHVPGIRLAACSAP